MRKFTPLFVALATIVALGLTGIGNVMAAKDYEMVRPPQPTTSKDKVEVVELFWYGCPHCFKLEPYVERWLKRKPENVKFVRMPGMFRPSWEIHGRAYYTAEVLGVVDKVHKPMFEAIHEQKRSMSDEASIMALFKEHGVSEKDFKRVFRSFMVETKLRRAKDMGQRYGVRGVPALIVNGKYRTSAQEAGGNAKIFKVVNKLVKMESE
ncbi:MAG TPA: thiol:disulfide interchange protein DsbA/DsbL [Gammaproteobacteria bacterium]|nr:thiol:disulfide interchange protein DsbA/DsbL [Gammaproteobacteria bacterium]